MTVYVDDVRRWPTRIRCFRSGSCHMTADTLEELHAMARRIGLRPGWYQNGRVPHYDLTPARRKAAILAGAMVVSAKEQARRRIEGSAGGGDTLGDTLGDSVPAVPVEPGAVPSAGDSLTGGND